MAGFTVPRDAFALQSRSARGTIVATGLLTLLGAIGGVALWLLADLLSRPIIGGQPVGNGALIVTFTGGPALLAANWTLLAMWRHRGRRWAMAALVAFVLTLLVELAAFFIPAWGLAVRPTHAVVVHLLSAAATSLLALAAGILLARPFVGITRRGLVEAFVACVLIVSMSVGLWFAFYFLSPLLRAIVLTTPLVSATLPEVGAGRGRVSLCLTAGFMALTLAIIGGFVAAILVFANGTPLAASN